jgi:hypothetical protein
MDRSRSSFTVPKMLFRREIGTNVSLISFIETVLEDLYLNEILYDHYLIFQAYTELLKLCRKSISNKIIIAAMYSDMYAEERSIVTLCRRVGWKIENWELLRLSDEIRKDTL